MWSHEVIKNSLITAALCLCSVTFLAGAQAQEQEPLTYQNEAMGIKLTCPQGWFMTPGEKAKEAVAKSIADITAVESIREAYKKLGILIIFSKYPYGSPKEFNPNITLTTEEINPEYADVTKTALDIANASIMNIKIVFKDVKLIKEPSMVTLGGREGAHFIYEATVVRGYLEVRLECSAYIFIKDNIFYTLAFTDKADEFNNSLEIFESSVNTFVLQ